MARNPEQYSGEHSQSRSAESPARYEAPARREQEHHVIEDKRFEPDSARSEALEHAIENKKYHEQEHVEKPHERSHTSPRSSRKQGFTKTMERVQKDMRAPQRLFSKIIHSPMIEKTSDVIGSTIARPDAILSGSVSAFIFTAVVYFTARYFGFSLSGSETILAFIAGWLVGLLYDLVKGIFRRRT